MIRPKVAQIVYVGVRKSAHQLSRKSHDRRELVQFFWTLKVPEQVGRQEERSQMDTRTIVDTGSRLFFNHYAA